MGNDDVADPTRGNEYREWIIEAKPREGREWIEGVEHQNKRNSRRSIVTASLY